MSVLQKLKKSIEGFAYERVTYKNDTCRGNALIYRNNHSAYPNMQIEEEWDLARNDLGLDIVTPFYVMFEGGEQLKANILLKNFGGKNGMLILTSFKPVKPYMEKLKALE